MQRLSIQSRPLIFRRRGKFSTGTAVAATAPVQESRVIDAEVIHGDEQAFWGERRSCSATSRLQAYVPTWDRVAQTLILLSRRATRVPQEAAFRIFAVFLKVLLVTKVTDVAAAMLPLWTTMRLEGLVEAQKEAEPTTSNAAVGEKNKPDSAAPAVAASDATPPASTKEQ